MNPRDAGPFFPKKANFPGTFATLDDARAFSDLFFTYYNNEHRFPGVVSVLRDVA